MAEMKAYNVSVMDFSGHLYSTVVEAEDEFDAKCFGLDDIHEINRFADLNTDTTEVFAIDEIELVPGCIRDGLRVQIDKKVSRVQLVFKERPDDATIAKLKVNGFRWSPKNRVWQRQSTENGIEVAKKVFRELGH